MSAPLDIMAMSADEAAEHLANMRVAIADIIVAKLASLGQQYPPIAGEGAALLEEIRKQLGSD